MCACAHVSANGLVYAWPHPVIPKRYLATNPITPFLSRFGLKFPFSNYPHPAKHTHTHTQQQQTTPPHKEFRRGVQFTIESILGKSEKEKFES